MGEKRREMQPFVFEMARALKIVKKSENGITVMWYFGLSFLFFGSFVRLMRLTFVEKAAFLCVI